MLISIVTPTFNSEKTIGKNAHSIVNQTYKNFEHVIIDNLSKDNTLEIVKKIYKEKELTNSLKIISEQDRGISHAFNKGISSCTGEVVGILNSDDFFYSSNVLEKVAAAFTDDNILFVHGDVYFVDPVYGTNIRRPLLCPITTTMPYNHPTMFIRKDVYIKYGIFDEKFKYAMDYALMVKFEKNIPNFREKGKYLQGDPLVTMHSGGASWMNELNSISETKQALKEFGFWNFNARKQNFYRMFRTKLKKYLTKLNLNFLVKSWRKNKWHN